MSVLELSDYRESFGRKIWSIHSGGLTGGSRIEAQRLKKKALSPLSSKNGAQKIQVIKVLRKSSD